MRRFLAIAHSQLLFQSPFLLVVGVPFTCLGIALACYVASIVMSRV